MKLQTLSENLIKALNGIKESQVDICNVIVNRKPLLEALKINDCGLVEIETGKITWTNGDITDKDSVRLKIGRQVLTFFGQSVDFKNPFPAKLDFTGSKSKVGITINSYALLEALNYVMPCIATDESRPALQCLVFDSKDGILKLVSADGYRLAKIQLSVQGIPDAKILIELNDVKRLYAFLKTIKPEKIRIGKMVKKEYPDITMQYLENTVKFYNDSAILELERLDKPTAIYGDALKFPDYELLIPNNDGIKIEFVSNDMLQAVNSLKETARNGSGIIRMQFFKGTYFNDANLNDINCKCLLSAKSEEIGTNVVEIDCKVNQDCKFALNYKYLADYLSQVKNSIVSMYVTTTSSPAKFELDNKIAVLMPMFVQWDNSDTETKTVKVSEPIISDETEPENSDEMANIY